jgi:hypothetical protein
MLINLPPANTLDPWELEAIATPAQMDRLAQYQRDNYYPVEFERGNAGRLIVTLERISESTQWRWTGQIKLSIAADGTVAGSCVLPAARTRRMEQPEQPAEPEPQPGDPVAIDPEPTVIQNGDRIRFLEGSEHPELANTEGTATRVGTMRLLATADATGHAVSISLEQVELVERSPEPVPAATKPRRARNARSRQSEAIIAPSA